MSRRARLVGFGMEEVEKRFPGSVEAARERRHGHGLGLRPSRYVGKHRGFEEMNEIALSRSERKAERRRDKKAHDLGFGA